MKNKAILTEHKTAAKRNYQRFMVVILFSFTMLLMAFIFPSGVFTQVRDNEFLKELRKKLHLQSESLHEERVYLHLDKPMYEPGDDIWFSAYLTDAISMKPGKWSDILHVELIDPKGAVARQYALILHSGKAAGDMALSPDAPGGMYKLRAYTNWMKNKHENNYVEREIQVQDVVLPRLKMKLDFERKAFGPGDEVIAKLQLISNENKALVAQPVQFVAQLNGTKIIDKSEKTDEEGYAFIRFTLPKKIQTSDGLLNVMIPFEGSTESISRSIPIVLNQLRLDFFPEGGDLVNGLSTRIAFRALNEFGKPADVEGDVYSSNGKKISSFSSFHQGMGAFEFTPSSSEKYEVKITHPEGIKQTFTLPAVADRGYVLTADNSTKGQLNVEIGTTENEELSLAVQMRGKSYYTNAISALKGVNRVLIPTHDMPSGVAQITLFDSKGIARCERLVFMNKDRQLNVAIETEKEKYQPREKVKMNITVKDERGFFVPAHLSLSVVNDQFFSFADDKSGNILSWLLLEQDINEKVEDPAFYFNSAESKADKALDFLLMTSGWRHFTWEQILEDELSQPAHEVEKALISGVIYDGITRKPIPFARIKTTSGKEHKADTNGRFVIRHHDLYEPLNLEFIAQNYSSQQQVVYEYNQSLVVYLFDKNYYKTRAIRQFDRDALIPAAAEGVLLEMVAEDRELAEVAIVEKNNRPGRNMKKKAEEEKKVADNKNGLDEILIANADTVFFRNLGRVAVKDEKGQVMKYYRARQFPARVYKSDQQPEHRTDFPTTLYWNPLIEVNKSGKATVEFFAADEVTSYRAIIEGVGHDGNLAHQEKTIYTQLPFQLSAKLPIEVVTEDKISVPVTLKNNTQKPIGGSLLIQASSALKQLTAIDAVQTIMPGSAKTIFVDFLVNTTDKDASLSVLFQSCGHKDGVNQKIKIVSKGFPQQVSFSGQEKEKTYSFLLSKPVTGSLKINVTAYPNVVSDLLKGIEGILREPSGCFEQTSMSSYPNAMVLDYLRSTGSKDDKTLASATSLLDKGYKRLITFETKEKGYEWFGSNPGHEALTAYGLMQFADMKRVGGEVSTAMVDRTAAWLMARKDGKGGFTRNERALDNFGRASEQVTNAYIVYALSEAGYTDIKKEFSVAFDQAIKSGDAYELALISNAAFNLNETTKAGQALIALLKKQTAQGSFEGAKHSITYSQGHSLIIETTALATLAMMRSTESNPVNLTNGIKWLVGSRNGFGAFGNTQGTVLALKALTAYAKMSRKVNVDGKLSVYMDGKKVTQKNYLAGEKDAIVLDHLEQFIDQEGTHDIAVKFDNASSVLPYSISVAWNTTLPNSQKECVVDLQTKLLSKNARVGETVRLQATVTNKKSEGIPSTLVVLGIPAGFTVQPWQLKELQEKKVFDFYEITGNTLAIYYRCMAPSDKKEINLDLKAEIPGEFEAPASAAYLYYTNELKTWAGLEKINIAR